MYNKKNKILIRHQKILNSNFFLYILLLKSKTKVHQENKK